MMSIKNYVVAENKHVVRNDSVVIALRDGNLDHSQYKLFAAQRAYVATNFVRLVDKASKLAIEIGDHELADALQSNLRDELGIDPDGKYREDLDHRKWKENYLQAIGIEADVKGFPLLNGTQAHVQSFLNLESCGTVFGISGAILSLENIIPLEYRAAVCSRDALFPEIFCQTDDDSIETIKQKATARKYMDDHIIHDSKSHFPDLLSALLKYENDPIAMAEIKFGIDIVNSYRKQFYESLNAALRFSEPIKRFFTYGNCSLATVN